MQEKFYFGWILNIDFQSGIDQVFKTISGSESDHISGFGSGYEQKTSLGSETLMLFVDKKNTACCY